MIFGIEHMSVDEKIVHGFFLERFRARAEYLLEKGRRRDFLELIDPVRFRAEVIEEIPPVDQNPRSLLEQLRTLGAPKHCYVVSQHAQLDQPECSLESALQRTVGFIPDTIISCVPGVLAYYEGEPPNQRFILHCHRRP